MMSLPRLSLHGLSIGDALGDQFFGQESAVLERISRRDVPPGPWPYTDDTVMAVAVLELLEEHGEIHQDLLAARFARDYSRDDKRGYGGTAHRILRGLNEGVDWKTASSEVFGGMGSMGNGAAMRVAPLGAFFRHDPARMVEQAMLSAEVTHAHPEAQAGAVAVASAAACIASGGSRDTLFDFVLEHTPDSETRAGIHKAERLPRTYDIRTAVSALGNGTKLLSQDTVPLVIWCAARHLDNFEEAFWCTVAALGDRDTTCAMVGGIVALADMGRTIPPEWDAAREPLESTLGPES